MKLYMFSPRLINNRAKMAYSYLNKMAYNMGRPIEVVIEPTNYCNMKCPMCRRTQDNMIKRGLGFMKMPVFCKTIDAIKGHAEAVDLYLAGEPLLHPDIIEMINYCGKQGLKGVMHTNATFLNEDKARAIIGSSLEILDISFDGATKETYEQIRVGGKFEQTLENIERYLRLKKAHKGRSPYTIIHMVYMEKNRREVDAFFKKWRRAGVDEIRVMPFNKTGLSEEGTALAASLKPDRTRKTRPRKPCFLLWRFLVVHYDGTVVPCCMDFVRQMPVGSIMEKSIDELWNGPVMKRLRELHIGGRYEEAPLCRDCSTPSISRPALLASIFVDTATIKKKILPVMERFWLLKKIKPFGYYDEI